MAPARIFISDDFPEPLTPMSPTRSPSSMTSSRSRNTVRLPKDSDREAARSRVILPEPRPKTTRPERRSASASGHDEHETAVSHVPAMDLYGLGVVEET